jgi:hypothetical protein
MMQNTISPPPLQMYLKHQKKSLRLMESRKNGQNHQKKEIIPIVVKEGGSANSQ